MKLHPIAIFVISIPLLANMCSEKYADDSTIIFTNNSSDTILYYEEFKSPLDTILPEYSLFPTEQNIEINCIPPNSIKEFPGRHIALFEKLEGEVDMWYIFKIRTIREFSWDCIVSDYMIERRYDLSLSDLDSLNWAITYP